MKSNFVEAANQIKERLGLQMPPIALAFVKEQPSDVLRTETVAPSSCSFWHQAETEVFYAAAEDHLNCPLGAMVMGFPLPEKQMAQLQEEVGMMCGLSYIREQEVANVPHMAQPAAGIVYGSLERFPLEPDAVLLWLTPQQAMVMSECCGFMNWAASPTGMLGRPGCAAIPVALAGAGPLSPLGVQACE